MARHPVIPADTPELPENNGPTLFSSPAQDQAELPEGLGEYLSGRIQEQVEEGVTVEQVVCTNVHDATYIDINSETGEIQEVALEASARLDTGETYNWTFTVE